MKGYQTHEAFWADFKMYFNLIIRALIFGLITQIVILYFGMNKLQSEIKEIYLLNTKQIMPNSIMTKYLFGVDFGNGFSVEPIMMNYTKGYQKLPPKIYRALADRLTFNMYKDLKDKMKFWLLISLSGYGATILYLLIFLLTSRKLETEKFVRGATLDSIENLNKKLLKKASENPLSFLKIGETIIPFYMEATHMLIIGTSGSGKGVLLNQLFAKINERKFTKRTNDRCIIYDLKGEYVSKQFNSKTDLIFSPFDERSLRWSFFNEIETLPDFDVVSKSLYVADKVENEYWYNCAKDVFRTGLIYLKRNGMTTNRQLFEFFSQTLEEIQFAFQTLPLSERGALKHIDKSDSQTSASIISILQERIQFFRYLMDTDGDFCFKKFIRSQITEDNGQYKPHPNLFILNIEQYRNIFKPLMSLAIDTMIRETLTLPDSLNRRIFFILDELGSLYKMDSVMELLTAGRSKGACLICASQDLGRLEETYGKSNTKTFFNNFNTNFTFRIREPETAEFLSKAIGERQIVKKVESRQMSPSDIGDRKSWADQEKLERLVLPTEFLRLEDLEAILNIANFGISKIKIPRVFYKEKYRNFIMKQFDDSVYNRIKDPANEWMFGNSKSPEQQNENDEEKDEYKKNIKNLLGR